MHLEKNVLPSFNDVGCRAGPLADPAAPDEDASRAVQNQMAATRLMPAAAPKSRARFAEAR